MLGPNLGPPGEWISRRLALPPPAGAFVISIVVMIMAGLILLSALRPDPLLTATRYEVPVERGSDRRSIREVLGVLWSIPSARFAFLAVIGAHVSMVSLMTMTPVQMYHHGSSLRFRPPSDRPPRGLIRMTTRIARTVSISLFCESVSSFLSAMRRLNRSV